MNMMHHKLTNHFLGLPTLAFFALIIWSCTPKVTESTSASPPPQPAKPARPMVSDDPCAKFQDSKAGEAALDNYVIYRDYLRTDDFVSALPYWRKSFSVAPAADGKRRTHFEDGMKFYQNMMDQASDANKKTYLDSIFYMYDRMDQCYDDDPGYKDGRIAFDLYYKYRSMSKNQEIFDRFKAAHDTYGLDAPPFIVNPFTALLVEMYNNKELDQETAVKYAKHVLALCEKNKDNKKDGWPIVLNYAPARMEVFETVKGFFDCDYYTEKYFGEFEENPTDCDVIETVFIRLRWGGCNDDSEQFKQLRAAYDANCKVMVGNPILSQAKEALEDGRYQDANDLYEEYLRTEEDTEKRALYNLRIAKIYYAHLKDFPKSRQYARKALEYKPQWGDPYILIGKLYASSGPLCGPGRGWDSQIVTWPAIDKFNQAKSVDPTVRDEANKWIRTYSKYMPSNEDIFQRQMTEGQSFRVGCWIGENTTIRAAKK